MNIGIQDVDFFVSSSDTRLPFRFGAVTLTHGTMLTARARIDIGESGVGESGVGESGVVEGFSSDLLVPRWFDKRPGMTPADDVGNLIAAAREAARVVRDGSPVGGATVFDHWLRMYRECVESSGDDAGRLVRGFGVALVERALMDAACRAASLSFRQALGEDLFGFRPGDVLPELSGWDVAESLPVEPLRSVEVRHTIGMLDSLRCDDIPTDGRVDDGFPQALEEDIRRYGVRYFKIKIGSGHDTDVARVLELARFFRERGMTTVEFTLDGNEQFEDLGGVVSVLDAVAADSDGRAFLDGLLYIEQPLHRDATFDPARNADMARLAERAAVIIDEADTGIDAFPRALELGYRGISVKNCKGVFRALLNRGLCDVRPGVSFQSAEDLTNLPVLALQQDLATVAALGLPHAERNGHHYFPGLAHLSTAEAESALAAHPDLYATDDGIALDIRDGSLDIHSLQCVGYGHAVTIDLEARTPVDAWSAARS